MDGSFINTCLDDNYRLIFKDIIDELRSYTPIISKRKVQRALVQHAFVYAYIKKNYSKTNQLLCLNSNDEICFHSLKKQNYNITAIHSIKNINFHDFCLTQRNKTFNF